MCEAKNKSPIATVALMSAWLGLAFGVVGCGGGEGTASVDKTLERPSSETSFTSAAQNPIITSLSKGSSTASTFLEIFGRNFGGSQFSGSGVLFIRAGGDFVQAESVLSPSDWQDNRIRVLVPASLNAESVQIQIAVRGGVPLGGLNSNNFPFTVLAGQVPVVTSVEPVGVSTGQSVTIRGTGFGDAQLQTSSVLFSTAEGRTVAASANSFLQWSDTTIVVRLPAGAVSGPVRVSKGSLSSTPNPNSVATNLIAADTTPPQILSVSPSKGTSEVDPRTALILRFSEAMSATVTNALNYQMSSSAGTVAIASPIVPIGSNTFQLTPATPLQGSTKWDLRLVARGAGLGVADLAGNALAGLDVFFTTSEVPGVGDRTPPSLVSVTPSNETSNVSIDASIVLQFSEPVTVAAGSVRFTSSGGDVTGTITISPASGTATLFTVKPPRLVGGTKYFVNLTSAIVDQVGNPFPGGSSSFSTVEVPGVAGSDLTPPKLVSSSPANNTSGVNPSTQIQLIFTKQMGSSASVVANYRLTTSGGAINPDSAVIAGTSVVLSFTRPLLVDTTYTLFLLSSIQDRAGNALEPAAPVVFSTLDIPGQPGDTKPPALKSVSPTPNATVGTSTEIFLIFTEAMAGAFDSVAGYQFTTPGGAYGFTVTRLSSTSVRITPSRFPLLSNTEYTLFLSSAITDLQRNPLLPQFATFRTAAIAGVPGDLQAPTVVDINPSDGSVVGSTAEIFVNYSEAMGAAAFSTGAYGLTTTGGPYPFTSATRVSGSSVKLTPRLPLPGGAQFTLLLTSNIRDLQDNPLSPVAVSFSTAEVSGSPGSDITPPSLLASSPTDGETNVDPNTRIVLIYSEAMASSITSTANYRITSNTGSFLPQTVTATAAPANSVELTLPPLSGNTQYSLILSNRITDKANNPIQAAAINFTTANIVGGGSDTTAPVVQSTNPLSGSNAASLSTSITVVFSKAVDQTAVTGAGQTRATGLNSALNRNNYDFFSPSGNIGIVAARALTFPPNAVLLSPNSTQLQGGTLHTLVPSNRIQDSAGNSLVTSVISFTTVNQPGTGVGDVTTPSVFATSPPKGSTVLNQNTSIIFSFTEAMTATAATAQDSVTNPLNYLVVTAFDAGGTGAVTPTVDHIQKLAVPQNSFRVAFNASDANVALPTPNRFYLVDVSNRLKDLAGNPLSPFRLSFVQGSPPTRPKVSTTSVDSGSATTTIQQITVTFDQSVTDVTPTGGVSNNFRVFGTATRATFAQSGCLSAANPLTAAVNVSAVETAVGSGTFVLTLERAGVSPDSCFRLLTNSTYTLAVVDFSSTSTTSLTQEPFALVFTTATQ